jgi:hypothetical protein
MVIARKLDLCKQCDGCKYCKREGNSSFIGCPAAGCQLGADHYDEVVVRRGGILRLTGRKYFIDKLDLEGDARLEVASESALLIVGRREPSPGSDPRRDEHSGLVTLGDDARLNWDASDAAPADPPGGPVEVCSSWTPNLRFVVLGEKATLNLGKSVKMRGVFCTPHGLVQLNNHATVAGKIVAREIQGGKRNRVVCPSGAAVNLGYALADS